MFSRIEGDVAGGELGFRFGEPIDLDNDGRGELVAGARYANTAAAWSSSAMDVDRLASWSGEFDDGLFGNAVVSVPDLDGDGSDDVIISEPHALQDDEYRGILTAFRLDGTRIWRTAGKLYQGFGWYFTRAGDHTGDGVEDLWVGAPASGPGFVYLVSGRDGTVALTIDGPFSARQFGWHIAPLGDIDGDGRGDLAIGAPTATVDGSNRGQLMVTSGTGEILYTLTGEFPDQQFGVMATGLDDIDGDGVPDFAVSAPHGEASTAPAGSEIHVISGAIGERIRLLSSSTRDELYGRMLATIDDLDGDGSRDLAIGAPWANGRSGRVEVRSAQSNEVLAELSGSAADSWFGWHITRSGSATPLPGLVISALRDRDGAGAIEIHELR